MAGKLWPDSDDVRAARNLNTTFWRVRATLAGRMIQSIRFQADPVQISVSADTASVDVIEFQDLTATFSELSGSDRLAAMMKAERLYAGDLLEGFDDDWVIPERATARVQYIALLIQLVGACIEARDYAHGLVYAGRLISIDPLNEDGHRAVMLLSCLSGNRPGALAHYRYLKRLLYIELGVEPSRETEELWSYARSGGSDPAAFRRFVMVAR